MANTDIIKKFLESYLLKLEYYSEPIEDHAYAALLSSNKQGDKKKIAENVIQKLKKSDLLDNSVNILNEKFSNEEIDKLLQFYTSNAFKKYEEESKKVTSLLFEKISQFIKEEV